MASRQRGKFLLDVDARDGHRPTQDKAQVTPDPNGNRAERRAAAKRAKRNIRSR